MRLIIEGWRYLPHSYGVVDQFLCRELLTRPNIDLFHRDIPYVHHNRVADPSALGDEEAARILSQIPAAANDQEADATVRIHVPFNFAPARSGRTLVFATAEFGFLDLQQVGSASLAALNSQRDLGLFTPSQWSRSGLIRSGADPDKTVVIPHGFDPTLFHPAEPSRRGELRKELGWDDYFIFLNLGALTSNKGIAQLLRAFATISADFPDARLVFKGLDNLYQSSRLLQGYQGALTTAQWEHVRPRLIYIGKTLTYAQTAALYQAADAYVAPYRAEGFNIPVLEAAACGLPVICTAGGPTDEFTDPSFALRIESRLASTQIEGMPRAHELAPDEERLEQHMRKVIQDRQFRDESSRAAPLFVNSRFTWKHIADQLLSVLNDAQAPIWRARPFVNPVMPLASASQHTAEIERDARTAYESGKRAEAARFCHDLLRIDPLHAGAQYLLGVLAMDAGQTQEAFLRFYQAAAASPETALHHHALGEAYNALGREREATESFEIALRLDPKLALAHNALGQVLLENGDAKQAVECFNAAIAVRPDYARAHLNLGRALFSQNDLPAARASFLEAVRLDPKYAIAHNNLGAVLQAQGELDHAASHFRQALQIRPDYAEAHCNLGAVLQSLGDTVNAAAHLREALRLRPQYPRARALLEQTP